MAKISPWLIIAVIVVLVVALTGESLIHGVTGAMEDAWDFWQNIWGQEQGQYGSVGLGVTIRYTDGTSDEYKPSGSWLLPLTILVDGKPIASITWSAFYKIDWQGTLTGVEASGDMDVWTQDGPLLIGSTSISYNALPSRNAWTLMEELTFTDTQIEDRLTPLVFFWVLEGFASCTMIFSFNDGTTDTRVVNMGPTQVHITYQTGGLTAFQVDLTSHAV